MKKYVIYNKRLGKYFEQDFVGWSYVFNRDNAYKFKHKGDAEFKVKWLKQEHECEIQEI